MQINPRLFSTGTSTVGRGKNAERVKAWNEKIANEKLLAKKAANEERLAKKAKKAADKEMETRALMKKMLGNASDVDELEHDELENEETVKDGIVKIAARSGLDLKGNTDTIDQVVKILKTFIKGKLKDVVFVENQDGVPVVTLDGIMKTIRKDSSIIGL